MARKIQPRSKTPLPKPGQSSEDYWRERETRQRAANIHDEVRYAERINRIFQGTQDSIEQEIDAFYQRYATKEGIDVFEARQRVSQIDMKKYERLAEQYVRAAHTGGREAAFSDEANEQMRLYNATMRINRLEMLKARCGIRAMDGYRQVDQLINESLEERAYSEYYRLAGILGNSVQFNENMVRSIVNASYQNATWSQRLWSNQAMLSEQIGAQLVQGILTGKSSTVLARNIQKLTGGSTYACQRLMRTEMRRVQTAAAEQSMRDNGVTEYKFVVANGVNPCDECLALDGQVFKVDDMAPGKNAPPVHPSCHCATAPHMDEAKWQRWLDGPAQAGVPWAEFESAEGINTSSFALNKESKHGTINLDNIPMSQAVIGAKTHEDFGRILKSLGCVNIEGLDTIPLESVRYLTAGMQRANELFGQRIITRFEIKKGMQNYGEHHAVPSTIVIGRRKAEEDPIEAYFTALHESAHDYDHSKSSGVDKATAYDYSSKIIEKALENLGFTMRGKDGRKLVYRIDHKWDGKDCSEVFAKAVEYGEAGKGNSLVKEIMRMLKEGEMP